MGSVTSFDAGHMRLVLLAAYLCLALVFMFIAATFVGRIRATARERRSVLIRAQWRPVLWRLTAFGQLPKDVPHVASQDITEFSKYWVETLNRVDGAARQKVLELGHQLQLGVRIRKHFHSLNPGYRALAVCISGWLQCKENDVGLVRALNARNPTLSFTAGMALLRLDRNHYGKPVLKRAGRGDWGVAHVAKILRELRLEDPTSEMLRLLAAHDPNQGGALLRLWAQVDYSSAVRYAREVLHDSNNEGWLICGALCVLRSPYDARLVRPYLKHFLWSVQVQAVNSLSRIGLRNDIVELSYADAAGNWWLEERILDAVHAHPQISVSSANKLVNAMQADALEKAPA